VVVDGSAHEHGFVVLGGDGQETKSPPAVIDHGTPTTPRAARK